MHSAFLTREGTSLQTFSGSSNSVHQFGDGQAETLCENVERVKTRLLGAVFKKM